MAEFKKISDVDVIDALTESDNILIVGSDGALKQTSSANIKGGASGYLLTLSDSNCQIDRDNYGVLCNQNYDELYDVLIAGGSAWFDFAFLRGMPSVKPYDAVSEPLLPEPTNFAGMVIPLSFWQLTDVGLFVNCDVFGGHFTVCFPNGSHNLPAAEQPKVE